MLIFYRPCVHGVCIDKRANYFCECPPQYGGKNCSVELVGCNEPNACLNNGTCKPYLDNETEHKFNCTCPYGFHGQICEKVSLRSIDKIYLWLQILMDCFLFLLRLDYII